MISDAIKEIVAGHDLSPGDVEAAVPDDDSLTPVTQIPFLGMW